MLISQINREVTKKNIVSVSKWNHSQIGRDGRKYAGHADLDINGTGYAVHITKSELETIIGYGFNPELVTLKYSGTY